MEHLHILELALRVIECVLLATPLVQRFAARTRRTTRGSDEPDQPNDGGHGAGKGTTRR